MSKRVFGPDAVEHDGVIATLVRGDELRSVHEVGERADVMRRIVERCDREGWLVLSLSTPESIVRDLRGSRRYTRPVPTTVATSPTATQAGALALAELSMLGKVGRVDLYAGPRR